MLFSLFRFLNFHLGNLLQATWSFHYFPESIWNFFCHLRSVWCEILFFCRVVKRKLIEKNFSYFSLNAQRKRKILFMRKFLFKECKLKSFCVQRKLSVEEHNLTHLRGVSLFYSVSVEKIYRYHEIEWKKILLATMWKFMNYSSWRLAFSCFTPG